MTKIALEQYMKRKLSTDRTWAIKALLKIAQFQTSEEFESENTRFINGVGFTGIDAPILTSFAKQYLQKGFLTKKQMELLLKKMPKYWRQIVSVSDYDKLEKLVENAARNVR